MSLRESLSPRRRALRRTAAVASAAAAALLVNAAAATLEVGPGHAFARIEYCCIHDSANRELDLVDAAETGFPGSDAVLTGNVIVKDPACPGNRAVIHFGQDGGGEHEGTLHMIHNTVVTPFVAPVLTLSAPGARSRWIANLVDGGDAGASGQSLAQHTAGLPLTEAVTGSYNWLAAGFAASARATGLDPATTFPGSGELIPASGWSLGARAQP